MMKKDKIEIPGQLGNRRIKIVVTNPVADDVDYARNAIKHINKTECTAVMMRGNMELEAVGMGWGERWDDFINPRFPMYFQVDRGDGFHKECIMVKQ